MQPIIFAAPTGIDPAAVDLGALTEALRAHGMTLDDGASLRGDGWFSAVVGGAIERLVELDWPSLLAAPTPAVALQERVDFLLDAVVTALTGTEAEKAAALAAVLALRERSGQAARAIPAPMVLSSPSSA